MHRVLHIDEILLEVFRHCRDVFEDKRTFAALARTCKAFNEPALDELWSELTGLSPLVRCLPGASRLNFNGEYALTRPLTEADWGVIVNFTRRVRTCDLHKSGGITGKCARELCNPPASISTIFPNLQDLEVWGLSRKIVPLLEHFAVPKLTRFKLVSAEYLANALKVFGERCPNMIVFEDETYSQSMIERISGLVCQWTRLRVLRCTSIPLNAAALVHVSHLPDLHHLSLELDDTLTSMEIVNIRPSRSGAAMLTFPALVYCHFFGQSLATPQMLFDHLRFPTIEHIQIDHMEKLPTEQQLESCLSALPNACNHQSLTKIVLGTLCDFTEGLPYHITFRHLHPLTIFSNIQLICLRIPRGVDLSERELLQLASSWPRLRAFEVGENEGCTSSSAVTPGGFVQLLERCPSLSQFSFMFDTRGYTEIPQGHPWNGHGMLEDPKGARVDVRYSVIEEESIEALGVFFHVAPFPSFDLGFGLGEFQDRGDDVPEEFRLYFDRWVRVREIARTLWERS